MILDRYLTIRRVTIVSAIAAGFLGLFKVLVGVTGDSHALMADGVHSFADLLVDGAILLAARAAHKIPDHEHPYGHGRIETLATAMVATMLVMVGITLAYDVVIHTIKTLHEATPAPSLAVFIVAVIAIIVNEALFRYSLYFSKKVHSSLITSNAWHHRSDGLVSVIVLISVVGSHYGIPYLDAIGAVIIAIFIIKMGLKMIAESIRELIDTGVDEKKLAAIRAVILNIAGVTAIHQLRTRLLGGDIFVDVHVLVQPDISVSEGHYISDHVWFALRQDIPHVRDVVVHVDPEDDEKTPPSSHLPDRPSITTTLMSAWADIPASKKIDRLQLHYCSGKINVDVYCPIEFSENARALAQQLQSSASAIEGVGRIHLFFSA